MNTGSVKGLKIGKRPGLRGKKKRRDGLVFPGFSVASRLELTCEVRQQPRMVRYWVHGSHWRVLKQK